MTLFFGLKKSGANQEGEKNNLPFYLRSFELILPIFFVK
jgi:hypothetical protein